ncbi:MAG: hypothetical protein IPN66_06925 [Candidatus Competibacteraceae bacterium]|nr:hypothetical protein [Candidatus Competibacteraceae bacterium]MBK8896699.1 hypothetical protein [Candidatus Competibacteraceae bacterium]MBK8896949.1 hypothetical protein [Candidatus Competibacteraceae bacterium]
MNPTRQTILHDKEAGLFGNCLQATLASLLHMPIDEVPHFCKIYPARWQKKLNEWLKPHPKLREKPRPLGRGGIAHRAKRGQTPVDLTLMFPCEYNRQYENRTANQVAPG